MTFVAFVALVDGLFSEALFLLRRIFRKKFQSVVDRNLREPFFPFQDRNLAAFSPVDVVDVDVGVEVDVGVDVAVVSVGVFDVFAVMTFFRGPVVNVDDDVGQVVVTDVADAADVADIRRSMLSSIVFALQLDLIGQKER